MSMQEEMEAIAEGLPTKSAKIRALDAAGYKRADIARFLGIRYQHVRNVLIQGPPKNERPVVAAESDGRKAVSSANDRVKVKIGPAGRIVIPAAFREAMDVDEGDTIVATVDEDGIVRLTSTSAAVRMAQRIVCAAVPPDVSLSDSLIDDRRREAAREASLHPE
ncbi:MAG: AbrB/MazE/SpoVT family DNA-binding domain-containing protein [Rhodospirillaceae bacterium]|nr:AbrB/MazE/SpoVT family DNA-binding domain-containing protein [Rhodospirillaceae bacterium]